MIFHCSVVAVLSDSIDNKCKECDNHVFRARVGADLEDLCEDRMFKFFKDESMY